MFPDMKKIWDAVKKEKMGMGTSSVVMASPLTNRANTSIKIISIFIVIRNLSLPNAPRDDMMQSPRNIQPRLSRHSLLCFSNLLEKVILYLFSLTRTSLSHITKFLGKISVCISAIPTGEMRVVL